MRILVPSLVAAATVATCAGAGHLGRRDVTVTEIITQFSTICPCAPYTQPVWSGYPISSSNLPPSPVVATSSVAATSLTDSGVQGSSPPSSTTSSATSTSTTTLAAPASTQTIIAASLGDYRTTILTLHNLHRRNHSATDLVWSDNMANIAAQIAASCNYGHNTSAGGGGYGQNIGAGFTPEQVGFMITNAMYDGELPFYPTPYGNDNPDLSSFGSWGHFSQIVWASTARVGCATQYCPNGLQNTGSGVPPYFTVCNYNPPGNYLGEFSQVHAPRGNSTIVVI